MNRLQALGLIAKRVDWICCCELASLETELRARGDDEAEIDISVEACRILIGRRVQERMREIEQFLETEYGDDIPVDESMFPPLSALTSH